MLDPAKRNLLNLALPEQSGLPSQAQHLLEDLLRSDLIDAQAMNDLPGSSRTELINHVHADRLLTRLVDFALLTNYQSDRIRSGNLHGLILGNYKVLERLGGGNHGVVFRGEHRQTHQQVAIKVLIPSFGLDPKPLLRFFAERKTVAQLSHPGIVRALDVGETTSGDPDQPVLYYYIMDYVPGLDLEQHIQKHGPMQPHLACDVAYQVANALTEAHKHNLVHRDIKPANILLTPEGRAMLLDFGAVRQFDSRQTQPGILVGILEWIAPEQVQDAHAVDIRADIYSLGCTLFWCLTGQSPYGVKGRSLIDVAQLPAKPPPTVRSIRNDLAPELDAVIACMMAPRPDDRYSTPRDVMTALIPFVSERYALAAHVLGAEAVPTAGARQREALTKDRQKPPRAVNFGRRVINWLIGRPTLLPRP